MREISREQIRAAMAVDPEFMAFADKLREKFGAKMMYLKTAKLEVGKRSWSAELERRQMIIRQAALRIPANSVWQFYGKAKAA